MAHQEESNVRESAQDETVAAKSTAVSTKRRVITAVQVFLGVLVIAALGWLIFKYVGYSHDQQAYRDLEAAYATEGSSEDQCPVDLAALKEQCPEVVAWIQMDDLDVSYPIMQHSDNDFYLNCDPEGNYNGAGSIFLDWRNNGFEDDVHAIVYGHNMLDGSMFGTLQQYTDQGFYEKGKGTFTIYTPSAAYHYQIFAVDIVDPASDDYLVGFKNAETFDVFVSMLKDNSMYDTGVEVGGKDHVVTLSTCSASDRLVVSAKRIDA